MEIQKNRGITENTPYLKLFVLVKGSSQLIASEIVDPIAFAVSEFTILIVSSKVTTPVSKNEANVETSWITRMNTKQTIADIS